MQHLRLRTTLTGLTIALAIAASGTAAIGQDEPAGATVAEVLAGSVDGTVTIEGAILGQRADDTYLFSDGTDVITIDVARSDTADEGVPTLTLMNIVGSVVDGHIEVSSWAPLEIMVPAVVRTPGEAIESFRGWIIVQNAQAAVGADDMTTGPADGDVISDD